MNISIKDVSISINTGSKIIPINNILKIEVIDTGPGISPVRIIIYIYYT